MNLLTSKLAAPDLPNLIARPRLKSRMDCFHSCQLTLVTACPGYGKTAFAVQAAQTHDQPSGWYRLDESDTDLIGFLDYLSAAVKKCAPAFSTSWLPRGDDSGRGFEEIRKLARQFLAALEQAAAGRIHLVLDDFHTVRHNLEINYFVQLLLDLGSPLLALGILSRAEPNLRISRLVADRQVNRVTSLDLSFTLSELNQFIDFQFEGLLDDQQMELLYEKTAGWISGAILFFSSIDAHRAVDIEAKLQGFNGTQRGVYRYFEENAFHCLAPDHKDFTIRSSILDQLSSTFCDTLLDIKNSRLILNDLEDSQSFTFSVDDDRTLFYYHPLFRDFLRITRELEISPSELAQLYSRAAQLYESVDEQQEALKHHIQAGNVEDASRLLTHLARPLIKQGRPQMVRSLLANLPDQHMADDPWFQFLQAGYLGLCNQLQLAAKGYEKVLKLFRTNEDEEGECVCRMELAEYYMSKGDFKQSEHEYKRILNKNNTSAYLTIIIMGYLIRVLTLSGKAREADGYARKAKALLPELEDEISLSTGKGWIDLAQGFRFAYTGEYRKALELGEQSRELFASADQHGFMSSSYYLISYSCFYLGQFSRGMDSAIVGLKVDSDRGISDELSEFLRLLRIRNWLETENDTSAYLPQAITDCRDSLESFRNNNFPVGVAQANLVLHRAYLRENNLSQAEQCLRDGIASLEDHAMPLLDNELKLALSELLFFRKDSDHRKEAMVLLKRAEEQSLASSWHMCWVARIYARYYWEFGHKETTHKYMVYSLKISEEEGFENWIASENQWVIPLLAELLALGSMPDYIKDLFGLIGAEAEHPLQLMQNHQNKNIRAVVRTLLERIPQPLAPSLRASLLGRFELCVGDLVVEESGWTSKKARTLFKYLLARRQRGYVEKEVLMELLWPGEDPQRSALRFHVALAALRKTLEPSIQKGVKSAYIKRSGSAYSIDIGSNGVIDTEEFNGVIALADREPDRDRAVRHYKRAEALYRGDFLEEDIYEEWCEEERDRLRQKYLTVLEKIVSFHERHREFSECIAYCNKYLRIDRYSETITRRLMQYFASSGNMVMVKKTYDSFNSLLDSELECRASEETHDLFLQLVSH